MPTEKDLRGEHRAKIEQPVRVRAVTDAAEIDLCRTLNVSKSGLYFVSGQHHYYVGMHVHLILGYRDGDPVLKEWVGEVLRIEHRDDGQAGIAVRILMR
jgi:hypothetical protein